MPHSNDEPLDINIPPPETRTSNMVLVWRCTNCGQIFQLHHAPLPEVCPNCGKDRTYFEQVIED